MDWCSPGVETTDRDILGYGDGIPGSRQIKHLEDLFEVGDYDAVRQGAGVLIDTTLKGLRYIETYVYGFHAVELRSDI